MEIGISSEAPYALGQFLVLLGLPFRGESATTSELLSQFEN